MTKRVFDIEANGIENVTQVWCYCSQNVEDKEDVFTTDITHKDMAEEIEQELLATDLLIGHNIIRYDLPVLEEVLGITYKGAIFDTLLASQLLNPDRLGGHSLAAWAKRLKRKKVDHDEWDRYSPEMLHRCQEDVDINVLIYYELLKEMEQ